MFFELIATFVVGLGTAGLAMLARKVSRGRLPQWLAPSLAGLAMIGFVVWSEYTWYGRTAETLPEGLEIAWENETQGLYRPWTYLAPITDRFLAVDLAAARTHPDHPDQRMVDLYLFGRWAPLRQVRVVMDCDDKRRADLAEGTRFSDTGALENANWVAMEDDDPVLQTACQGRTEL